MLALFKMEFLYNQKRKLIVTLMVVCFVSNMINVYLTHSHKMLNIAQTNYITFIPIEVFESVFQVLYPSIIIILIVLWVYKPIEQGIIWIPLLQGYTRKQVVGAKIVLIIITIAILLIEAFVASYLTAIGMGIGITKWSVFVFDLKTYFALFSAYLVLILYVTLIIICIRNITVSLSFISISLVGLMQMSNQIGENTHVLFTQLLANCGSLNAPIYKDLLVCMIYSVIFFIIIDWGFKKRIS